VNGEIEPPQRTRADLVGITLAVGFIAGLIGVSLYIILPFAGAIIWAALLVVSTWGGMRWLQARLGQRRWLAVTIITFVMLLVVFVPVSLAIVSIVRNADEMVAWVATLQTFQLPPLPAWVAGLPLVGDKIAELWLQYASEGATEVAKNLKPYVNAMLTWLASRAGGVGAILLQILATVIIAAVLYAYGESAAAGLRAFGRRLAGKRGENMVLLAGRAVRGVALGVVVTAIIQSVFSGVALAVAGVPFAMLLTGVMFLTCIAQIGPVPVLVPAIIWMFYWRDSYGWGTFLIVCTVVVTMLDNVLRPILIKRGADLPLLLIFAGVIGGLLTFGLIGIFVGPVVLAVTYTLLEQWVLEEQQQQRADS
jgi:predicted PurR-regulated permease PerM